MSWRPTTHTHVKLQPAGRAAAAYEPALCGPHAGLVYTVAEGEEDYASILTDTRYAAGGAGFPLCPDCAQKMRRALNLAAAHERLDGQLK